MKKIDMLNLNDAQIEAMETSPFSRRDFLKIATAATTVFSMSNLAGCISVPERNLPNFNYKSGIALINCNVADVKKGEILKNRTILIRKGKIISIEPSGRKIPSKFEIIDVNNKYVIPGLIDAHCHTTLPGAGQMDPFAFTTTLRQMKMNYVQHIEGGTTTVRDMGSFPKYLQDYIGMINDGDIRGPRIQYCTNILNIDGGHPDIKPSDVSIFSGPVTMMMGSQCAYFENKKDLIENLNLNLENKASFIKLTMDDRSLMCGKDKLKVYTKEHMKIIRDFSQKHNLPVSGHVHMKFGFQKSLQYGLNTTEHTVGDFLYSDNDVKQMAKQNIATVPTLTVGQLLAHPESLTEMPDEYKNNEYLMNEQKVRKEYFNSKIDRYVDKSIHEANIEGLKNYKKYACKDLFKEGKFLVNTGIYYGILNVAQRNMQKLREAGILIGTGTDAGIPFSYHGTVWRELEMMNRTGFSHKEVLKCATLNSAKIVRLEDKIGSIEKGKFGDIVVLDKNPYKDITAYREPALVMKEGKIQFTKNNKLKKIKNKITL